MREIESGKGMAEVARMFQVSPKRLETWKGEWRAKGELAFPGNGSQPAKSKLDADRIAQLERKIGQQAMEIEFLKKALRRFREHPLPVVGNGKRRLYQQIRQAAEAGAAVNGLCQSSGSEPGGVLPFSGATASQRSSPWIYAARSNASRCGGPLTAIVACMPNCCGRAGR